MSDADLLPPRSAPAPAGRYARARAPARAHWVLCSRSEVSAGSDWLGEAERATLAGLRLPKRRADWTAGRWAAKHALARCLADLSLEPSLADIQVVAAPDGAPEAHVAGGSPPLALSLSHSGELGFAVAATVPIALGCDVERVERRSAHFVRDYFTAAEAALVERAPEQEQPLLATLLWSAKESALKLRREGLRADTRSVEVRTEPVTAGARRGAFSISAAGAAKMLRGCWWRVGEYLCTVATALAREPPEWRAPEESPAWTLAP